MGTRYNLKFPFLRELLVMLAAYAICLPVDGKGRFMRESGYAKVGSISQDKGAFRFVDGANEDGEPRQILFNGGYVTFKDDYPYGARMYDPCMIRWRSLAIKVTSDSIKKVPLQTEKESEHIWNTSSDKVSNYQLHSIADSIKVDSLTTSEKKRVKDLAMQVPDSIRSRFSLLLFQWNLAINHNSKPLYSANTYSYAELPEFTPLESMGKQIIPLIMERLMNPSDFYLLVLYEAILKNGKTKTIDSKDNFYFRGSEQSRAIWYVKMWLRNN